jgi:isoaspartyl peptidase/L-asparaginase-like protein (Ntn-hydrolase superfamily)
VPALLIHGERAPILDLGREELRQGIRDAVGAGWTCLQEGGSAVDAVEAAVCAMEDNPRFNAGRGSVLTTDGTVEMDASISGRTRSRTARWPASPTCGIRSPWPAASSTPTAIRFTWAKAL